MTKCSPGRSPSRRARAACRRAFRLHGYGGGNPVYFVQDGRSKIWMVYSGDAQVRRIYLDVPHSEHPNRHGTAESVGHYEGDTLVIDTIGLNAQDGRRSLPHPAHRKAACGGALEDSRERRPMDVTFHG